MAITAFMAHSRSRDATAESSQPSIRRIPRMEDATRAPGARKRGGGVRVRFNIRGAVFTETVPNASRYSLGSVVHRHYRCSSLDFRNGEIISGQRVIGDYAILDAPAIVPDQSAPKMPAQSDGRCYLCGDPLSTKPARHGTHDDCASAAAREG